MPKSVKLFYFDFHGGRGETARLALSIGGVPFGDERVKGADWPPLKPSTPFGELPVLEVDGQRISQSNAINRYAGQTTGFYPDHPAQAPQCDEVCCAVEALHDARGPCFPLKRAGRHSEHRRGRARAAGQSSGAASATLRIVIYATSDHLAVTTEEVRGAAST